MMNNVIEQVVSTTIGSINITLVIVLLGIGVILKHVFKNLNNDTIPVIILCLGMLLVIAINVPFNPQTNLLEFLVQGLASGFCALIVHDRSKNIIKDLLNKDTDGNSSEQ